MVYKPNEYRNKDGIGMPADDIATDTTSAWTSVALLKGIFGKLGGGTAASLATDVAQGSTTAGQTGGLVQGAVTTVAPTYTTAKTNPLSLKTNGDLRVADADLAVLAGAVTETAPASDTASSGLNGRLQRVAQRLTSLIALLPASLGGKTAAASFSITTATDDPLVALLGAVNETAPASDTASSGHNGRLQRIAQRVTSLIALMPASLGAKVAASSFAITTATDDATIALYGAVTETAPATDTASSGLNGRLQRVAQRLTSLIALVPASLGAKTAAGSFSVTTATDDNTLALFGAVTETAPATDTASSGLNGRLQRVAQRITSMIALLPASLGQKAMSASLPVVLASDQAGFPVIVEGQKATYRIVYGSIAFTATGNFVQIQGSGTKTIRITKIVFCGTLTTGAVGTIDLFKTSTASSGGSPVTASASFSGAGKMDSNNAAATATTTAWSTPPSGTGTIVGGIAEEKVFIPATTGTPQVPVLEFGTRNSQALVLRGTSEYLQVYLTFASYTGASFGATVEWTEE